MTEISGAVAGYSWEDADRLFDQALELPADKRAEWLAQACSGNAALREQVEALLRADAEADRFLEFDALRCSGFVLDGPAVDPSEGRRIGPYRVVRELARGGMGVVYLAERADGQFQQRVALKLMKRGMDSEEIHQRFLAERQILAQLNHPHIARLLDGGVSAEGQPYFAIEYVDGTAITAHCEARQLALEERLTLFLDVCDAVRYAHQNLVVHRDLKPSNILVTADGQVKLLDFGIAKLLGPEQRGEPGLTQTGLRVMTPEYAAPEQVLGEPITTATDVYALGAVLYELLTARRAHRLESHTPLEVERVICEVEPEAPSAVASDVLGKRLRGDLDTITLTALQKKPERRYSTVEQLASDITRFLGGLPVTARPDTWRYRAAKFARRHRIGVAAAVAIGLSLVAGLVGTIWQARVAAEHARVASAEAAKQQAVRDFLVHLFQASSPGQTLGHKLTARELLDRGRRSIDTSLAGQPAVRAELLGVLGTVHRSLGLLPQADTLFGQAVRLTRSLPGSEHELAARLTDQADNLVDRSEYDRADSLATEALARLRRDRAGADDSATARPLRVLGGALAAKGNLDQAIKLTRDALALDIRYHGTTSREVAEDLNYLGDVQFQAGDLRAADSTTNASLAIWRRLLPSDHPTLLEAIGNLADLRASEGDFAGAESLAREVLEGRRRVYPKGHPDVAFALGTLAFALQGQERYAEAESLYVQALGMYRTLLGPDDFNALRMEHSVAFVHFREGMLARAEREMRESADHYRRALGPDNQYTLFSMVNLSALLREVRKYREAEAIARETLARTRKTLGGSHPQVAYSLLSLGQIEREEGRLDAAEQHLREALAIERAAFPAGHFEIARVLTQLGAVLDDRGKPADAEPLLREALAARAANPQVLPYDGTVTQRELGYSLVLQGRYKEGEALLLEAYRSFSAGQDYWSVKGKRETAQRLAEVRRRAVRR
jgi:tetratricopeptide (TPR) repeat protein/tRNA A-37 threonylcarbamoyl transferase component Bud32